MAKKFALLIFLIFSVRGRLEINAYSNLSSNTKNMKMLMICILNILNKVQFVKTYKKALNKISDLLRLKWTSWFLFIRVIPDKKATQIFIKIMTQYTYHHKILWLNKLPKIIMHLKNLPVTLTSLSLPQSSNSLSHCALLPCINCILFKSGVTHGSTKWKKF